MEANVQKKITHVIFDLDGVLVDTETLYTEANERATKHFDAEFTKEIKMEMMGRKKTEAVAKLLDKSGLAAKGITVDKYLEIYDDHIEQIMTDKTKELPGATKLIEHFHNRNIPLAICTSSDEQEFGYKMTKFDKWKELVPVRVLCGSDPEVKKGKPDPDAYLVTINRMKEHYKIVPQSAENVLVFEDSVNGVESALGAGCSVIMVPQLDLLPKDWPKQRLRNHANFVELIDSLEKFSKLADRFSF